MPRPFDLVVFDWDGTVVDSTAMIARCIQKAAADLGLTVPTIEQANHVIGLGLQDALAGAVPELTADRIEAFSARYRHHYFAVEPEIVLFDGIRELLVELAESGAHLAVATGKSRRGLDRAFARHRARHVLLVVALCRRNPSEAASGDAHSNSPRSSTFRRSAP